MKCTHSSVQAQAAMSANASAVDAEVGAGKPASAGTPAGDTSPLGASEKRPTSVGKYIYELVSVWVGGVCRWMLGRLCMGKNRYL